MDFRRFIYIVLIPIVLYSCAKSPTPIVTTPPSNDTSTTQHPVVPPVTPPVTPIDTSTPPYLYVVGDSMTNASSGLPIPQYWRNGFIHRLPLSGYGYATGIALSGSDFYISGYCPFLNELTTYWKDGQQVHTSDSLSASTAVLNGISVVNNDVYVVGFAHSQYGSYAPVYYKDGEAVHLITKDESDEYAESIAIDGSNVYVAGSADATATYWKNDTINTLNTQNGSSYSLSSSANSIVVSNGDVYIAGTINYTATFSIATYWKNGVPIFLTGNDTASVANAIIISGNDVYVAGGIIGPDNLTRAVYWKNGQLVVLDNADFSIARSVLINGSDIYVAGNIGEFGATYWKNGLAVALGQGEAWSITMSN